jgi:4-hydroxy-tetrahydrodipicolinate synthase
VSVLGDGVYTVVPTPFDASGALDVDSLARLVGTLAGLGVEGLLVLGVMGEAPKLLPPERRAVVETSLAAAGEGCRVVVGVTHPSVAGARALARAAKAAGAAAVLVAPPRLDRAAGDDAIVRYFAGVAGDDELEIVLQDHPVSSGVTLAPELIARLAESVPQIRSVKLEDPPTPAKTARVLELADVKVFGGLGGVFLLEELERGAHGTMTGFAFPEVLVDVYRAHAAGDAERAAEVFFRHLPAIRYEFQDAIGLALRKRAYVARGALSDAHVREPAAPLDAGSAEQFDRLLRRSGLLA